MSYITLTELKNTAELMGFNFADYDGQSAIDAASAGIDEYCGRTFTQDSTGATVARRFTPTESYFVLVDDLISAATVQTDWDGDGVFETTWTVNTDYLLEPFNAALSGKPYERLTVSPRGTKYLTGWPGSLNVIGQWGWPAVPAPVKQATTIMATRLLRRAREAPFGVVGLGIDNQAVRISRSDPDMCFLLDQFVKGQGVLAA